LQDCPSHSINLFNHYSSHIYRVRLCSRFVAGVFEESNRNKNVLHVNEA
jgi:hypothetical protein